MAKYQYYVCVQNDADRNAHTVILIYGPFDDRGPALHEAQKIADKHVQAEVDRVEKRYHWGPENYTPTDQISVWSVDQLRAKRAAGQIRIAYRVYLGHAVDSKLSEERNKHLAHWDQGYLKGQADCVSHFTSSKGIIQNPLQAARECFITHFGASFDDRHKGEDFQTQVQSTDWAWEQGYMAGYEARAYYITVERRRIG